MIPAAGLAIEEESRRVGIRDFLDHGNDIHQIVETRASHFVVTSSAAAAAEHGRDDEVALVGQPIGQHQHLVRKIVADEACPDDVHRPSQSTDLRRLDRM